MGSVIPLLAVAEELKKKNPNVDFCWLGTRGGLEEKIIRDYNMDFKAIWSGKFRRYFSWLNLVDMFKVLFGFIQSIYILARWRPDGIVSAGGFVAVPVVWAGWLLGVPSLIHQQDVRVGLANKLCSWVARKITVCFEDSAVNFNPNKTQVVGNPVREAVKEKVSREELLARFKLKEDLPVVLVMGGGRGAASINELALDALDELIEFCQVIHITGAGEWQAGKKNNYIQYDFLVDSLPAFKAAEVVVSRAGMGSLTEIAYLKKPAVIIPMPDSHQEDNAAYFYESGGIIVLDEEELDEDKLVRVVKGLLKDKKKMKELGERAYGVIEWGAEAKMVEIILGMAG